VYAFLSLVLKWIKNSTLLLQQSNISQQPKRISQKVKSGFYWNLGVRGFVEYNNIASPFNEFVLKRAFLLIKC